MLTVEGLHEPLILFEDAAGNVGTVPPAQIVRVVPKLNVGVSIGFTVTAKVVIAAHCPISGVKV